MKKIGKKEKAIFDKIIRQFPPENNRFYIEHNKKTDTFRLRLNQVNPEKWILKRPKEATNKTKLKQAKNLFKFLIKDKNSVFYSVNKINKNIVAKAKRLVYAKDKVFIKLYNEVENKNCCYTDK